MLQLVPDFRPLKLPESDTPGAVQRRRSKWNSDDLFPSLSLAGWAVSAIRAVEVQFRIVTGGLRTLQNTLHHDVFLSLMNSLQKF